MWVRLVCAELLVTVWVSLAGLSAAKAGTSASTSASTSSPVSSSSPARVQGSSLSSQFSDPQHKDCLFREFRKLCATVAENNSYNAKTQIIEKFLRKGTGGGWCIIRLFGLIECGLQNVSVFLDKFHGDLYLTVKLLLPGVVKSVYNLNDKQIVKLFSRIFRSNQEEMVRDLEQVRSVSCPDPDIPSYRVE